MFHAIAMVRLSKNEHARSKLLGSRITDTFHVLLSVANSPGGGLLYPMSPTSGRSRARLSLVGQGKLNGCGITMQYGRTHSCSMCLLELNI